MNLPLVNTFKIPYEAWTTKTPSIDEIRKNGSLNLHVKDKLVATVCNPLEAAEYIIEKSIDNGLSNFINSALDNDICFKTWRRSMPSKTPKVLSDYQQKYNEYAFCNVDSAINEHGAFLSEGQILFHGGVFPRVNGDVFTTNRPLSTTLCPQVAICNAIHRGKAYDNGRIDLFVLRVCNPKTKVFVFRRKGTSMGHENEILFASGAKLRLCSPKLICNNYKVHKAGLGGRTLKKDIPAYVMGIDIQ